MPLLLREVDEGARGQSQLQEERRLLLTPSLAPRLAPSLAPSLAPRMSHLPFPHLQRQHGRRFRHRSDLLHRHGDWLLRRHLIARGVAGEALVQRAQGLDDLHRAGPSFLVVGVDPAQRQLGKLLSHLPRPRGGLIQGLQAPLLRARLGRKHCLLDGVAQSSRHLGIGGGGVQAQEDFEHHHAEGVSLTGLADPAAALVEGTTIPRGA
mmetsp:Transcript_134485/g.318801  ORF Transcript_134485/g.318801 Transcript_134485/m.318801 type:complete len:208 (+) Transcript_134485:1189-1812(+)